MTTPTQSTEITKLQAQDEKIWVTDPKTGHCVDVTAFLNTLHEFEPGHDNPLNAGALDSLKRILRFFSLIVHDPVTTDFTQLSNVYNDLWRLWEMFEATSASKAQNTQVKPSTFAEDESDLN